MTSLNPNREMLNEIVITVTMNHRTEEPPDTAAVLLDIQYFSLNNRESRLSSNYHAFPVVGFQ